MPEDNVKALLDKLEEHFTKRKDEIISAIHQAMSIGDKAGRFMLKEYLEHIDGEHIKLTNIKDPEAFAGAVAAYLNRQYNLENQMSDQSAEANDFTKPRSDDGKLSEIQALQALAVKIIKPKF